MKPYILSLILLASTQVLAWEPPRKQRLPLPQSALQHSSGTQTPTTGHAPAEKYTEFPANSKEKLLKQDEEIEDLSKLTDTRFKARVLRYASVDAEDNALGLDRDTAYEFVNSLAKLEPAERARRFIVFQDAYDLAASGREEHGMRLPADEAMEFAVKQARRPDGLTRVETIRLAFQYALATAPGHTLYMNLEGAKEFAESIVVLKDPMKSLNAHRLSMKDSLDSGLSYKEALRLADEEIGLTPTEE